MDCRENTDQLFTCRMENKKLKKSKTLKFSNSTLGLLCLLPIAVMFWIWLSPLAFVPVPWPDDSAFYFVAKEFFKWPPRWVMLPQAPFEPTYRIFNFNTMPLYPILIGIGRWLGIDGSFAIKIWPLGAWALSGALLVGALYRKGLSAAIAAIIILAFSLDPEMRWASVLVRPESLIGFFGMALVLGLSFGFPNRLKAKGLWDPVSALLALSAYAHFNAIHLLFMVAFGLINQSPRKILATLGRTVLYLSPWLAVVLLHFNLFVHQMETQWTRLAVPNDWLTSMDKALGSLFQQMGNPVPWPASLLHWVSVGLWFFIFLALLWGLIIPALKPALAWKGMTPKASVVDPSDKNYPSTASDLPPLAPAAGWIVGTIWLWGSKPEVWFVYYIHLAIWAFVGIAALRLWVQRSLPKKRLALQGLIAVLIPMTAAFAYTDIDQTLQMNQSESWNWDTYHQFVNCVDKRLTQLEQTLEHPKPFRIWGPTFPDILIELSRHHPDWEFSRTNDFWERADLAIQHGQDAEAVVVTETLRTEERHIDASALQYPELKSVWMTWDGYFLNRLWRNPTWKLNRYICQRGRWQAFLFMK